MFKSNAQPNSQSTNSKVICVLGMHRSGTSCLIGCLQENGLYLGDVVNQAPHNKKGNKENLTVREINNLVLQASGGSWNSPPAELLWGDQSRSRRDELIASYPERSNWGFKDPRTMLTLPFWLEALPNMVFVGTFRHPAAVARSFAERDNMPLDTALALWKEYNLKLIEYQATYDFPLVCFDWSMDRYLTSVAEICKNMGLDKSPSKTVAPFYDKDLRHHHSAASKQILGDDIMDIYASLCCRANPSK